jgi:hypothetical protein
MREFRVISAVLIRKRNYKIALARKGTIAKARSGFGFDPIYNLRVERHIIVRKINISRLRHQGIPKKQKEDSEVHVREITSNGFHGKTLVCRSEARTRDGDAVRRRTRFPFNIRSLHRPVTPAAAGSFTALIKSSVNLISLARSSLARRQLIVSRP